MHTQYIEYAADGLALKGYLADGGPADGRAPGVIVAHEAMGLNARCRRRADQLAALGYVAFALDLYGREDLPLMESIPRHEELMAGEGVIGRRALAALAVLLGRPNVDPARIGAVGYCQGGITVLELARLSAPIQCAVGVHPGLKRPAGSPNGTIKAKVLMIVGNDDPVTPGEDRAAFVEDMQRSGADWQLHLLGGVGHSFTNPDVDAFALPGIAYNGAADARAWSLTRQLLEETLAATPQAPAATA